MRHMLSRLGDSRSGMSTVLGTVIFVGILFTSVIPLFVYVNQVNSYYDKTVTEMGRFDQEREMERVDVFAYPTGENLAELNVYIKNKCALVVRVIRVWVNNTFYDQEDLPNKLPLILPGVSEDTITGIGIPYGYFDVLVTTDRGNVFASLTNTIHVNASGWEQGTYNFGIPIFITGGGQYKVNVTDHSDFLDVVTIKSAPTAFRIIQVPKPGKYYVRVTCGGKTWPDQGEFERSVDWERPISQQIEINNT